MFNSISNLFPLLLFLYPSKLLGCTLLNCMSHLGGLTSQLELELIVESKFGFRLALIIQKPRRFANQSCSRSSSLSCTVYPTEALVSKGLIGTVD